MDAIKCLDTYALVEISNGNKSFEEYITKDFVINDLTLAEFYAVLLRVHGETRADYWFKRLEQYSFRASKEVLIEAVKFRYNHKKQRISFFDAVGYIFSVKNNMLFVTGNNEFEGMASVEFRK